MRRLAGSRFAAVSPMSFQKSLSILCVIVGAACGASCSPGNQDAVQQYVRRGDEYAGKKEFREAIIEYRNALKLAPQAADARLKVAEAYEAVGDWDNALAEYIRAADLMPTNHDVQLKAGSILLAARGFDDAEARARRVLAKEPRNAAALMLLSNAQAGKKHIDEAIAANERALAIDPNRPGLHVNLGVLQFVKGERAEAEAVFTRAIKMAPQSAQAHLALGKFYRAVGRRDDAERTFKKALELDPQSALANEALAVFLIESGRGAQAEGYVKAVSAASGGPESRIWLADYYVSQKRYEEAIAELQQIPASDPFIVSATVRIAIIEYSRGKRDQASALVDSVLEKHPLNANALAYKSQFLLARGNASEALRIAKEAVAANPNAKHGHFALGKAHYALGELEDARKAFTDVINMEPNASEAALELALIHLSRREIDTAIEFARRAVETAPGNLEAQLTLVRTLSVRREDAARAEPIMRALLARDDSAAEAHLLAGDLGLVRNNHAAARAAFERALALEPDSIEALKRIVNLDIVQNRTDAVRRRLELAVSKPSAPPGVLLLAARFYAQQRDFEQAISLLKRVIARDAANLEAYSALGAIYVSQRRLTAARTELMEVARREPSISTLTMVGLLYHLEGQLDEARSWYEKALKINSRAAAAANNLAWLYAERNERLDVALNLAQTARAELPTQPEVTDTLGWVYYKKDLTAMAIPLFTQSLERDPDNPLYLYHLGVSQARQGNDAAARALLQRALKLQPDFANAADARRALHELAY
jgi:putative PEP-CTERM system TPR-repeat lipoprotein